MREWCKLLLHTEYTYMTQEKLMYRAIRDYDNNGYIVSWKPKPYLILTVGKTTQLATVKEPNNESIGYIHIDDFSETEEECWEIIYSDLASEIMDKESEIESIQRELQALKDYQSSLL